MYLCRSIHVAIRYNNRYRFSVFFQFYTRRIRKLYPKYIYNYTLYIKNILRSLFILIIKTESLLYKQTWIYVWTKWTFVHTYKYLLKILYLHFCINYIYKMKKKNQFDLNIIRYHHLFLLSYKFKSTRF